MFLDVHLIFSHVAAIYRFGSIFKLLENSTEATTTKKRI